MAKLPDDKRAVFTDIYKFYEENWDMPDTVEAWKALAEKMKPLSEKHGGTHLVNNLMLACYQTINDDYKEVRDALSR